MFLPYEEQKMRSIKIGNHTLWDYYIAVSGEGPLDYQWKDKPHRLIYDLVQEILKRQ